MEIWKDIEGAEGRYQVSNLGRVKSVARIVEQTRKDIGATFCRELSEKILNPAADSYGYKVVSIRFADKLFTKKVHRLVAEAFLENERNFDQVNHIDGDKANNILSNLEWCTAKQNSVHKCKALGIGVGASNGRAKLTDDNVMKIDEMLCAGYPPKEIAAAFGVKYNSILRIKLGENWSNITGRRRAA